MRGSSRRCGGRRRGSWLGWGSGIGSPGSRRIWQAFAMTHHAKRRASGETSDELLSAPPGGATSAMSTPEHAIRAVIAFPVVEAMRAEGLTKTAMAARMKTGRRRLDRARSGDTIGHARCAAACGDHGGAQPARGAIRRKRPRPAPSLRFCPRCRIAALWKAPGRSFSLPGGFRSPGRLAGRRPRVLILMPAAPPNSGTKRSTNLVAVSCPGPAA